MRLLLASRGYFYKSRLKKFLGHGTVDTKLCFLSWICLLGKPREKNQNNKGHPSLTLPEELRKKDPCPFLETRLTGQRSPCEAQFPKTAAETAGGTAGENRGAGGTAGSSAGGTVRGLFQKGLEVCYCDSLWGCHPDPRLGPILGPSRSHPGSEVVPSRFAMCFVLQCFVCCRYVRIDCAQCRSRME